MRSQLLLSRALGASRDVRHLHKPSYADHYTRSRESPAEFWAEQAQTVEWFRPWDKVLTEPEHAHASHRWYSGGLLNTSYNALDVHVNRGKGNDVALHFDSPLTSTKRSITYSEMLEQVSTFAGGLRKLGVEKGDCVIIYMSSGIEAAIAMLACARLGAIHSVVFGGFAAQELAARIEDAQPKVVIATSCGIEPKGIINYEPMLSGALERSAWKPSKCIVFQRDICRFNLKPGRDMDWHDVMASGCLTDAVPVLATDPLYILYTSGTTGKPKGVVRDNGGHAVALKYALSHVFNTHEGETFWAASDIGWTVAHSLTVYGPLLQGCTTVMFEGKPVGTPDAGAFWRVLKEYNVRTFFTAPTALRSIRKEDPHAEFLKDAKDDIKKNLQAMFVAGERGDPNTLNFFAEQMEVPIIDHWWQTETGWPITSPCLGLKQDSSYRGIKFGSVSRPVPGWDVHILTADSKGDDEHHSHYHEAEAGTDQELVVKLPLPPGALTTLYKNEDEFYAKYLRKFPGFYHTGDTGHIDDDGYVYVMSRTDDVINVAGHRLSTGSIEEVIQKIPEVVECAVFGATDSLKGHVPVALVVLDNCASRQGEEITTQVVSDVRSEIGSFACLKSVAVVNALPKTRSGKVLRGTIQAIADSRPYRLPPTIENEAVLGDIRAKLQTIGYADKESMVSL